LIASGRSPQAEDGLGLRAIAVLIGLLLLGLVDNQILSPVLREIAASFDVSVGLVGMTVTGYALAAACAALFFGPLSDRTGRRPFLLGAGLTFTLGATTALLAPTYAIFAAARIIAGASAGVISALVVATIADHVPYERRGRAMSWVASAYFAAPILFVPAASWLADRFGWRALYVVFASSAVIISGAFSVWIREHRSEKPEGSSKGVHSAYLTFLKERSTAAGAFSAFFVSGGVTAFILYLGAYLGDRFGLSVTSIGLVFLLSGSASLVGALGAGPLSDRVGKRPVAIGGSLALVAFILAVPRMDQGIALYAFLGLTGLAAASRIAPLQSLVTELVSRETRGAFVALRNTLSQLGIAFVAAVGGVLYEVGGYQPICYLAAGLSFLAAVLLWLIEEPVATGPGNPES
jgi:predicted MFS family arabinose efflux permease